MRTSLRYWLIVFLTFCGATQLGMSQNLTPPTTIQIGWASNAFDTNIRADGVTTFEEAAATIRFELGTFSPGFDPRTATPEQWVSSWIVLQGTDYDLIDQQFIQTATLSSNATPFAANTRAYIWGYTSKDVAPTSEWLLVSAASWKWPDLNAAATPPVFSMGDAGPADAIIGQINPSNGDFHMQLAYVVIPEPGSAFMGLVTIFGLVWMRRR
jgi:hypothetical protein